MTWIDWVFIFIMFLFVTASIFCWIFTIISFWRKEDGQTVFPKKNKQDKRVSDLELQKQILDFYNKFKNG